MNYLLLVYHIDVYRSVNYVLFWFIYTMATEFQLYLGGDVMYEMRRTTPEPTLLQTQALKDSLNLPKHGARRTGL